MYISLAMLVRGACLVSLIGVLPAAGPTGKPSGSVTVIDGKPLRAPSQAASEQPNLFGRFSASTTIFFRGLFGGEKNGSGGPIKPMSGPAVAKSSGTTHAQPVTTHRPAVPKSEPIP